MLRFADSICWLASSNVTGDTLKRARDCKQPARAVFSGSMKATSAGYNGVSPLHNIDIHLNVNKNVIITNSIRQYLAFPTILSLHLLEVGDAL